MPPDDDALIVAMLANPGAYFAGLSTTDPRAGHISEPSAPGYRRVPFARRHGGVRATFAPLDQHVELHGWFVIDAAGHMLKLAYLPGPDGNYAWRPGTTVTVGLGGRGSAIRGGDVPLATLTERRR